MNRAIPKMLARILRFPLRILSPLKKAGPTIKTAKPMTPGSKSSSLKHNKPRHPDLKSKGDQNSIVHRELSRTSMDGSVKSSTESEMEQDESGETSQQSNHSHDGQADLDTIRHYDRDGLPAQFLSRIIRGLFCIFVGPGRFVDPKVNPGFSLYIADKAHAFFDEKMNLNVFDGYIFYEEMEMDQIETSFNKVSSIYSTIPKGLQDFIQTVSINDRRICITIPLFLLFAMLLASGILFYFSMSGSGGPLSDPKVNLLTQGGVLGVLLLLYAFLAKVPYHHSQELTMNRFEFFVKSAAKFCELQLTRLHDGFLTVDQNEQKANAELLQESEDYAICWSWAMMCAFLLTCGVRNSLFHAYRDTCWWRWIGKALLLLALLHTLGAGIAVYFMTDFLDGTQLWNLVIFLGGVFILFALTSYFSRKASEIAKEHIHVDDAALFGSIPIFDMMVDMARKRMSTVLVLRDLHRPRGPNGTNG